MGVISAAIGKYLSDKDRWEDASRDLDDAQAALRDSTAELIAHVARHGSIEGLGHVFALEDGDLIVFPVRNCYTIDREADLSRAAADSDLTGGAT